jgi:hypothetical protein
MKFFVLLLMLFLGSVSSGWAQSEDWMLPPEMREFFLHEGEDADKSMNHNSPGTHWYEIDCCSGQDCRPYSRNEYEKVPGGYRVWYLPMTPVFVPDKLVKPRPHGATPDEFMHFCIAPQPFADVPPEPICAYPESLLFWCKQNPAIYSRGFSCASSMAVYIQSLRGYLMPNTARTVTMTSFSIDCVSYEP